MISLSHRRVNRRVYRNGEISRLICDCPCSYTCKHEFAAMLQLRETLDLIDEHYSEEFERTGYFAAISKGTLFSFAVDGKNVFLSVDSRSIPGTPFCHAFKAKSFTTEDVTFHFYILDIQQEGAEYTMQEILDIIFGKYLCHFASDLKPDISTIRYDGFHGCQRIQDCKKAFPDLRPFCIY